LVIPNFAVPKCENCGELVFDYVAEEQINQAYQAQTSALANGANKQPRKARKKADRKPA
jgi:hypothetical protein